VRPNATTISEASARNFDGIAAATLAFIEHVDARLGQPLERDEVLREWRSLAVHQPGDRIQCVLGDRTVSGTWAGIDEQGRAMLRSGDETIAISAGDLVLVPE
jgi:biotin-(acetyl-CoA carboxylase) ligase